MVNSVVNLKRLRVNKLWCIDPRTKQASVPRNGADLVNMIVARGMKVMFEISTQGGTKVGRDTIDNGPTYGRFTRGKNGELGDIAIPVEFNGELTMMHINPQRILDIHFT